MAKVLTMTRIQIESADEGTTKSIRVHYKVEDSGDASLCKSGQYTHPTPDFTKTVDALFTECVSGVKTLESIA